MKFYIFLFALESTSLSWISSIKLFEWFEFATLYMNQMSLIFNKQAKVTNFLYNVLYSKFNFNRPVHKKLVLEVCTNLLYIYPSKLDKPAPLVLVSDCQYCQYLSSSSKTNTETAMLSILHLI